MAPAHCITTKLCPLLNSKYLKCSVNIARFRSKKSVVRQLTASMEDYEIISDEKPFHEMVQHRQSEARRTIIVQLNKFNDAIQCTEHLRTYGKISCVYHYVTKLSYPNMLLVQFKLKEDLQKLLNTVKYLDSSMYMGVPTMMMQYQSNGLRSTFQPSGQLNFRKYSHHFPTWVMIRSNLLYSKTVAEQMVVLCKTVKLTDIDIRLRYATAHELCLSLGKLFPTISILPFGSSITGFGQLGCDLDIVCTFTDNSEVLANNNNKRHLIYSSKPFSTMERNEQQEFLKPVAMLLNKFIPGITNTQSILKARVPIVKFSNNFTSMQCDLSSNNLSGFYMSEILYTYGIMDSRVKPLVFTLRKWAYSHGITSDVAGQRFTNFSLTLLIMFYLQQEKVLPSMYKMLLSSKEIGQKEMCVHVKPVVRSNIEHDCTNDSTLEKLLIGFFEFYATFDFGMHAICVRESITKKKPDLSPVYLYNPLDPLLNVSRNISANELKVFISHCINALKTYNDSKDYSILYLIDPTFTHNNSNQVTLEQSDNVRMREMEKYEIEKDIDVVEPNKVKEIIK